MFPLNWNIPFIRKNGSRTTLGAITGDIAGIEGDVSDLTEKTDGLWDNMMDNGAVNLLPNNATTDTINGVTFTVNSDGTVTANGTATADARLDIYTNTDGSPDLVGKTVKLTGCPSGGGSGTYRIHIFRAESTDGSSGTPEDTGNGAIFTWRNNGSGTKAVARVIVTSGQTVSDLVFKPMLSDASLNLSYDDYVPYAMTNRELTKEVTNLDTVIGGMNGYTAGDFNFIPPTIPYIQYVGNTSQWNNPIADAGTEGGSLMWIGRLDTQARLTQLLFCNNGAIYQRLIRSDNLTEYTYGNWNKNTV